MSLGLIVLKRGDSMGIRNFFKFNHIRAKSRYSQNNKDGIFPRSSVSSVVLTPSFLSEKKNIKTMIDKRFVHIWKSMVNASKSVHA